MGFKWSEDRTTTIWEVEYGGMVSGQGDAVAHVYDMYVGSNGRAYFVPSGIEEKADHIHCTAYADWDKTGEGFAGAHLTLKLTDGSEFILKGGWHTNADSLYRETGVDVRRTHLTYGAVGLDRPTGSYMAVSEVLYYDAEPRLGLYHRLDLLGLEFANKLGKTVYVVSKSRGGGHCGPIEPGKEIEEY